MIHLFFVTPTDWPPQSAPVKLCTPVTIWLYIYDGQCSWLSPSHRSFGTYCTFLYELTCNVVKVPKRPRATIPTRRTNTSVSGDETTMRLYAFCTNGWRRPQTEARFIEQLSTGKLGSWSRTLEHFPPFPLELVEKYSTFVRTTESIWQSRTRVVSWRTSNDFEGMLIELCLWLGDIRSTHRNSCRCWRWGVVARGHIIR